MKKTLKVICSLMAVLLAFSFSACKKEGNKAEKPKAEKTAKAEKSKKGAESLKENPASDFKYTMTDDGAGVKITAYIGKSPKIVIPAEIEGLPVLEVAGLVELDHEYGDLYWNQWISEWVYPKNNITITHIVFPDSVRKTGIEDGFAGPGLSLRDYDALEYVKLPAGIKEVEDKDQRDAATGFVFSKAKKSPLTGKGIPVNSLPQFIDCDNLKTVIIPEGIKAIPTFEGSKSLESITLPSTVEYVPTNAFNMCSSLKEIIIPENVEKIAFYSKDEYGNSDQKQFIGTNLNLTTQAKLKQLGYEGSFGAY